MNHSIFVALYLVLMVAVIVTLDVLFLRDLFWWRLATNIVIALTFATLYLIRFKDAFK